MVRGRHQARKLAFQALFEVDCSGHAPEAVVDRLLEEQPIPEESKSFARSLVLGVQQHWEEIDKVVQQHATSWPLGQISVVDRNILRLAIFEILFDNTVPAKVAINEAVELAKAFGSDHSPSFVNGVLGGVLRQLQTTETGIEPDTSTTKRGNNYGDSL